MRASKGHDPDLPNTRTQRKAGSHFFASQPAQANRQRFSGGRAQPAFSSRSGQAEQPAPGLTFPAQDWFRPILNGKCRICANCRHWDLHYKACLPRLEQGQLHFDIAAPCAVGAVAANAGDCVPMLGETGSCVGHADLFAPSDDYLNEMLEESEMLTEFA